MLSSRVLAFTLAVALPLAACSDDATSGPGADADTIASGDATDLPDADPDATTPDAEPGDTQVPPDGAAPTDVVVTDTAPQIPPPDVTVDLGLCSPPGGSRNIYDLQNPDCPDHIFPNPVGNDGVDVELDGVIVTGLFGDTLFVQEPPGGPYSGITVFAHGLPTDTDLAVGDRVNITGSYSEFFENSQIYLDTYDRIGPGAPPEPYVIAHPSHIATNGPIGELFEGVLVRVEDVHTLHTQPDCPRDYGEFAITGLLRVDDLGYRWDARLGDHFESITGPLMYAFGNFKMEPRDADDVVWTVKGLPANVSKCVATECQAPIEESGTKLVVINEHMPDPWGPDSGREWIELHNPGSTAIDITGWQVRDCGDLAVTLQGGNLTIPAGGYLVLAQSTNFLSNGGVPADYAYGTSFYLPNTVGAILLYNGATVTAELVDQVRYSRFDAWVDVFIAGASLERVSPTGDGTTHANWKAATRTFGSEDQRGTPGEKNSATP